MKFTPLLDLTDRIAMSIIKKLPSHVRDREKQDIMANARMVLAECLVNAHNNVDPTAYVAIRVRGATFDYLRGLDPMSRSNRKLIREGTYEGEIYSEALTDTMDTDERFTVSNLEQIETSEMSGQVKEAVRGLPKQLQSVIIEHDYKGRTLQEIADDMGVTESRVCQLRTEAIRILKGTLKV